MFNNNRGNPAFGYEDIAMRDTHLSSFQGGYESQTDLSDHASIHSRSPLNPGNRRNQQTGATSSSAPGPGASSGTGAAGVFRPYDPYGEPDPLAEPLESGLHSTDPSIRQVSGWLSKLPAVLQYIVLIGPALALFWIPGILQLTAFPAAKLLGVPLLYWSIWLSIVWGGYFIALAAAQILPGIVRHTVGAVAVMTRRYIAWMRLLYRYVAVFGWSLTAWITFQPLIDRNQTNASGSKDANTISILSKLLFALFICAALLLAEKVAIQFIADKFHERSYAERVDEQKRAIQILTILYANSTDVPGRSGTTGDDGSLKSAALLPRKIFKTALRGVQTAASFTTSSLGTVASQLSGGMMAAPDSPQAAVESALNSANKTRALARRLFYSFCKGKDHLVVSDFDPYFKTSDDAATAFNLFDRDKNGDLTQEELEMACMDMHREQLAIASSMRDLDSAVGRLDNILISLWTVISLVIIAASLDTQVSTLIASAGTLILGLSWLIGNSLQEVLTSIIFLFVKHPFDVGDRIVLDPSIYTVKEMRLLSTILIDANGGHVQAPNLTLSTLYIKNLRRSSQMSEKFTFDVAYSTSLQQIEDLRVKMLAFVLQEKRDFLHAFDVVVVDIPDQTKLTLSADIRYKSNWQSGALTAQRRNKWICALKQALSDLKIYGPSGDPNTVSAPARFTQVPWEDVKEEDRKAQAKFLAKPATAHNPSDFKLAASNSVLAAEGSEVFGDRSQDAMTETPPTSRQATRQLPTATQVFAPTNV